MRELDVVEKARHFFRSNPVDLRQNFEDSEGNRSFAFFVAFQNFEGQARRHDDVFQTLSRSFAPASNSYCYQLGDF